MTCGPLRFLKKREWRCRSLTTGSIKVGEEYGEDEDQEHAARGVENRETRLARKQIVNSEFEVRRSGKAMSSPVSHQPCFSFAWPRQQRSRSMRRPVLIQLPQQGRAPATYAMRYYWEHFGIRDDSIREIAQKA